MRIFKFAVACLVSFIFLYNVAVAASSCGDNYFASSQDGQQIDSVEVDDLQAHLDTSSDTEGMKFAVSLKGDELWLDLVKTPSDISALVAVRTIFIIGRIVKPAYAKLVLSDEGKGLFQISYQNIHAIGCQFVWGGQSTGQNPTALMRQMVDSLEIYPSGDRLAPPFNGSLLGDTSLSLKTMTERVYPEWLFKHVEIEAGTHQ